MTDKISYPLCEKLFQGIEPGQRTIWLDEVEKLLEGLPVIWGHIDSEYDDQMIWGNKLKQIGKDTHVAKLLLIEPIGKPVTKDEIAFVRERISEGMGNTDLVLCVIDRIEKFGLERAYKERGDLCANGGPEESPKPESDEVRVPREIWEKNGEFIFWLERFVRSRGYPTGTEWLEIEGKIRELRGASK